MRANVDEGHLPTSCEEIQGGLPGSPCRTRGTIHFWPAQAPQIPLQTFFQHPFTVLALVGECRFAQHLVVEPCPWLYASTDT